MEGRANSAGRLPIAVAHADDFYRMSARKLVYRFMVVAPAIFLAGIGVNARSLSTEFDTIRNDARTDRAILAYVPYMRETEAPLRHDNPADLDRALGISKKWLAAANRGELKALPPIAYEDTSTEGAKSQVFEAKSKVVFRLLSGIEETGKAGNYAKMSECATAAIRMSEILKYSDFISLFNCTTEQRRATDFTKPFLEKLDVKHRSELIRTLSLAKPDTKRVDQMARLSRHLFLAWRVRNNYQPLAVEDTKLLREIPVLIKGDGAISLTELRDRMFASNDRTVPSYCSSVRLGLIATKLFDTEIATTLRVLKREKAAPVKAEPSL